MTLAQKPGKIDDLTAPLDEVFGFHAFRPNQEEIIRAILDRRDIFAVMPTGGGKSLCYQLPSHLLGGTCIVISPLISLMKDQVDAVRDNGIHAEYFNSSLNNLQRSAVLRRLSSGELDLLYVAPERFAMGSFISILKGVPISLFAVDEAHCISEWGHDFRPDYLSLSLIVEHFADVPVAAFTATATKRVQRDIIDRLALRDPHTVRASFDRPNLFYEVADKDDVNRLILLFLHNRRDESGIIYRTTRADVEGTASYLASHDVKVRPYHAGLDSETRKKNQDAFNRDEINVIVATIAFGMGIDKSNVRFVVHGDLPKNIESYYQETGRAGRDGEPAHCLLFFGRGDTSTIRYFINQMEDETQQSIATEKLNQMVNFAVPNTCRRRRLLSYFGERFEKDNCGTCDVCTSDAEQVDAATEAQIVMSAILRTGQRFGAAHVADVVTGANTKKIRELRHNEIKTYGAGKDKDKRFWRRIIDDLLAQKCLIQTEGQYPVLQVTPHGREVLFGRAEFYVRKRAETPSHAVSTVVDDYNRELFERLRSVRARLAGQQNVPPFVVFSDRTLHEMACYFPVTPDEMRRITGVGEMKLQRYSDDFLPVIRAFVESDPQSQSSAPPLPEPRAPRQTKSPAGKTFNTTWQMLKDGLSRSQIAERRGLTTGTVSTHIERLILDGRDIELDRHVEPAKQTEIERLFKRLGMDSLREIVEASDGTVGYEEVRIVRAAMQANSDRK